MKDDITNEYIENILLLDQCSPLVKFFLLLYLNARVESKDRETRHRIWSRIEGKKQKRISK